MKKPSPNLFNSPFSGFFMGMVFFTSVFGFKILNPTYADWLFTGDSAQHYLGWEFFRNESWKNPLGLISSYGIPDGSSVVYTDSIPLLAIFFKIFKSILPQPF
ncbi:MAG TPA: DUF6311 domain-containing protein, partial [bacterium]|nr:DUF6311 domain-containing protein [bacterium]